MKIKIIETGDHSHSLYNHEINEKYHSLDGAWTESLYVYIAKGLEFSIMELKKSHLNIFEMGFGTGLNAFQTWISLERFNCSVKYQSVENMPLPDDIISQLNYSKFTNSKFIPYFEKLHDLKWNEVHHISNKFSFIKQEIDIQSLTFTPDTIDLIYYDAFAPNKQPEVWSQLLFEKLFLACANNAVLVTYCAQGEFKRTLKQVGFIVERLPGPPGKREMTRAIKP